MRAAPEPGRSHEPKWLMSRHFWPGYVVAVLLFLALVRPWQQWDWTDWQIREGPPTGSVLIHRQDSGFLLAGEAGVVVLCAEPVPDPPAGWLPCDGRELVTAEHPALFEALGGEPGDSQPPTFRAPDYRGLQVKSSAGSGWRLYPTLTVGETEGSPLHFFISSKATVFRRDPEGNWTVGEDR